MGWLNSKNYWPHFQVAKDRTGKLRIGQYMSMNKGGRASVAPGNDGTIQVEIGGKAANPFTNQEWLWEPVRALFQAVRQVYPRIPNAVPYPFKGSNEAYGRGAKTRVPIAQWNSVAGLVGHQNAPNNDHWDPGAIDGNKLLCLNPLCGGGSPPQSMPAPAPGPVPVPAPPSECSKGCVWSCDSRTKKCADPIGKRVCFNVDGVNQRSRPSTAGSPLGQWARSQTPIVNDGPVKSDGYTWYQLGDVWTAFSVDDSGTPWFSVCLGTPPFVPPVDIATNAPAPAPAGPKVPCSVGCVWSCDQRTNTCANPVGQEVCITADTLNKRSAPSATGYPLGQWSRNDRATIKAGPVFAESYYWFKLDSVWSAYSKTGDEQWFGVCSGTADFVPPANIEDEVKAPTEIGDENVVVPPCVADKRRGLCIAADECTKKAYARDVDGVAGCSVFSDPDIVCCVDEAAPQDAAVCDAFGVVGTCEDAESCVNVGRLSFPPQVGVTGCEKLGEGNSQCCAETKGTASGVNTQLCSLYEGGAFPLSDADLLEVSVNFGFPRANGARCHTGIDLYTKGASSVLSSGDGVVVAVYKNAMACTNASVDAVLVYHETGALANITVMYAGLDQGSYSVGVGSKIAKGAAIGTANKCHFAHFELYSGRTSVTSAWTPAGEVPLGCVKDSMHTKPIDLIDPRDYVRCLMPTSGVTFRHGLSFLEEPSDLSLFSADAAEETESTEGLVIVSEDDGLGAGAIAGIVIGVLLLIALVVLVAVFVVKRRENPSQA
jgi:hypothetical protein